MIRGRYEGLGALRPRKKRKPTKAGRKRDCRHHGHKWGKFYFPAPGFTFRWCERCQTPGWV